MGKGLIRFEHDGRELFAEWSEVVDAPVTSAGTEEETRAAMLKWYGTMGCRDLDDRLRRCRETGTSFHGETLQLTVSGNRAGHHERCLTLAELVEVWGRGINPPPGVGHRHDSLGDCYTCALCYPGVEGAQMPADSDLGIPLREALRAGEVTS
jgi:hypothetical protein